MSTGVQVWALWWRSWCCPSPSPRQSSPVRTTWVPFTVIGMLVLLAAVHPHDPRVPGVVTAQAVVTVV